MEAYETVYGVGLLDEAFTLWTNKLSMLLYGKDADSMFKGMQKFLSKEQISPRPK